MSAGQTVAKVGSTGSSTGNHVHFEVRINGGHRPPLHYVKYSDTSANFTGARGISGGFSLSATGGSGSAAESKEITAVYTASREGKVGNQDSSLRDYKSKIDEGNDILIQTDGAIYRPVVEGEVTVAYERKNTPGKMTLTVYKDSVLRIHKGSPVRFRRNGKNIFFGYVFTFTRQGDRLYTITCYDQLRYLKNSDVMSYKNKTYSQLLKDIAKQYKLECGTIENTKYVIKKRMEEGTLFDILGNAADLTRKHADKTFVLYDNFGKLTLKNMANMKIPILIDVDTLQDFDYESSIDDKVYNRVKLYHDNGKTGKREVHVRNATSSQKRYGILQYVDKASGDSKKEIQAEAKKALARYDQVQRKLSLKGCFGVRSVRGGTVLKVKLPLGDLNLNNWMIVERATHTYGTQHFMDLDVYGAKGQFQI